MKLYDNIPVFGELLPGTLEQLKTCLATGDAVRGALMSDHHIGYSCPIGGVVARRNEVSPSEIGFDISCGTKAVLTDASLSDVRKDISKIMDLVVRNISFGVGRVSNSKHIVGQSDPTDHPLFDSELWDDIPILSELEDKARNQLGTVGSGNHYVDIFHDEQERIWIGVHFGSRGLGHGIASHYIKAAGGVDGMNVPPAVISLDSDMGQEYWEAMCIAGDYAYAGRDWVCSEVARILGANILDEVHNHHNFAWKETHFGEELIVHRKGATPAAPGQLGFVGGTMGEDSVILRGALNVTPEAEQSLFSTVHGAGRVLSRTAAAGKSKWKKGKQIKVSEGCVSQSMMDEWVRDRAKVELRGGGTDESPHCYKRLTEVLDSQGSTIEVLHTLTPIGVAMAGSETVDPYKD